jgi:hypothetical protein
MTIVPIRPESRLAKVTPVIPPPQIFSVYLPPPPECGIYSAIFKTASILKYAGSGLRRKTFAVATRTSQVCLGDLQVHCRF